MVFPHPTFPCLDTLESIATPKIVQHLLLPTKHNQSSQFYIQTPSSKSAPQLSPGMSKISMQKKHMQPLPPPPPKLTTFHSKPGSSYPFPSLEENKPNQTKQSAQGIELERTNEQTWGEDNHYLDSAGWRLGSEEFGII